MPAHHKAWRAALAAHGATFDFDWTLFTRRAGMGLRETVRELNLQFGAAMDPDAVVKKQREAFAGFIPSVREVAAVAQLALEFRASGGRMSVASGGEREVVCAQLAQVGMLDMFEHVVCAAEVPHGKPHPDMFLRCSELMGVPPKDCLVFEDAEMGLQAAEAAGMDWVAVDGSGRCRGGGS